MWTTLAVAAALSAAPHEAGKLALTNVRATHGMLGPTRAGNEVLPGDTVFLCFDIEGITVGDDGKVRYGMGLEVVNDKGKTLFKQAPRDLEVPVSLGGSRVPGHARIDVGLQQPPGEYTVKVTVTDRAADKSETFSRTFQLLEKGFGLVRVATTSDQEGQLAVAVPGSGEGLWLHYAVIGFERDKATKQPDVTFEMRVLDADGKPVRAKPMSGQVNKDVPDNVVLLPMGMVLSLNRPGKFKVELTANDKVGGKKAKLTFPLTVVEIK